MTNIAFLIGNGLSREGLDLEQFRGKGTIIGCNALYRDFTPDVLIAADQPMIITICESGYADNNYFIAAGAKRKRIKGDEKAYILPIELFHTTGTAAMYYAGMIGAEIVYLIGYDCYGQTIYRGTKGYADKFDEYRYKYIVEFHFKAMKSFPETTFVNVIKNEKDGIIDKLPEVPINYASVDLDFFTKFIVPILEEQDPVYYHEEFRKIQAAKKASTNTK